MFRRGHFLSSWPPVAVLAASCPLVAAGAASCMLHAAACCLMVNRLLVTSAAYAVRLVRWTAHNGDSYTAAPRSSRWCTRRLRNSWCNTARATFLDGFKLVCCCVFCTLVWSCVFCNMVWRMSIFSVSFAFSATVQKVPNKLRILSMFSLCFRMVSTIPVWDF